MITLITDFGMSDAYAGVIKGVILSVNPDIAIVDLTHEIAPGNVDQAAFVLHTSCRYFPDGSVHVVVVDPGVGSGRQILAVCALNHLFVAPDNGVLKYIFHSDPGARIYSVTRTAFFLNPVSRTFHGRDIFAPVAAHLSIGVPPQDMGEPAVEFIRGSVHLPEKKKNRIYGHIVYIDRFGNAISNIPGDFTADWKEPEIHVQNSVIRGLQTCYSDVPAGEPLALLGSNDTIEISVRNGNAAESLGIKVNDPVQMTI